MVDGRKLAKRERERRGVREAEGECVKGAHNLSIVSLHKFEPIPLCVSELIKCGLELAKHLTRLAFIARRNDKPYRRADNGRSNLFFHLLNICFVGFSLAGLGLLRFLYILRLV